MVSKSQSPEPVPLRHVGGVPLYDNGAAPEHLRSRTHLERVLHRALAPSQQPQAYVYTRYHGDLCALYDPAEAVPRPWRSVGEEWAWRARRTCSRCRTEKPFVLDGPICGRCRSQDLAKAARLQARTCWDCHTVGGRPFTRDRNGSEVRRCPKCRAARAAERRERFAKAVEAAQRCKDCGERICSRAAAVRSLKAGRWPYRACASCEEVRAHKAEADRLAARAAELRAIHPRQLHVAELRDWAKQVLEDPATVILDTETTGLHRRARIVEISIATAGRSVLLDTLVNPGEPIPPDASAIHGITDAMVATAPCFAEVLAQLERILPGRRVVIYNKVFDAKRLGHELGVVPDDQPEIELANAAIRWLANMGASAEDAMVPYSDWVGEWSEWHGNYRWQRLEGGHRALGDCLAVVELLTKMAQTSRA